MIVRVQWVNVRGDCSCSVGSMYEVIVRVQMLYLVERLSQVWEVDTVVAYLWYVVSCRTPLTSMRG